MLYAHEYADNHIHAYLPFDQGMRCFDELASMRVTDANLLAYTYIEADIDNNLTCLSYKQACKSVRLRVFGGLYYDLGARGMPFHEQAELLLEMGCDGMKFLDMKPNYCRYCGLAMDDPAYDKMYDLLEARGVPIVTHLADPASFWHRDQMYPYEIAQGWCYESDEFLTRDQVYASFLRRMERNPKLRLCLAHFGFLTDRLEMCHELCERFPGLRFDLTPGWNLFVDFAKDVPGWRDFFTRYSDRILYGTDTSTRSPLSHVRALQQTMLEVVSHDEGELPIPHYPSERMRGLFLDEVAQKNICHDNYFRFVGTSPRPLQRELIREHARLVRAAASDAGKQAVVQAVDEAVDALVDAK